MHPVEQTISDYMRSGSGMGDELYPKIWKSLPKGECLCLDTQSQRSIM